MNIEDLGILTQEIEPGAPSFAPLQRVGCRNSRFTYDKGATAVEFAFNLNGRRTTVYDGHAGTELRNQYYWGSMPLAYYTNDTHFQHQDWEGTERAQTSYNGTVEATYSSLPFGDGFTDEGNGGQVYGGAGSADDANHSATLDHDYETRTDHGQFRQYSHNQGR